MIRTLAIHALALATLLVGLAAPASARSSSEPSARPAEDRTTRVVLRVIGCPGCRLGVVAGARDGDAIEIWESRSRRVKSRKVAFDVPTALTAGMTVWIHAPWERRVGAVGSVVFAYAGQAVGDRVTTAESRAARRGAPCYAGTDAARLRLRVKVHRARFAGTGGRAVAPAAYTVVTQPTVGSAARTFDGFHGSQDVAPCVERS